MKKKRTLFWTVMLIAFTVPAVVVPFSSKAMDQSQIVKKIQTANVKAVSPFKDVSKSHWAYEAIYDMRDKGIVYGYPDGTYRPGESISRKHVAALLNRALPLEPVREAKEFKDIPKSHPYHNVIQKVQMAGIIDGDEKGNFNPEAPLTRVQMAKILDLAFDLEVKAKYDFPDVPTSHWGNEHVRALYSNGITMGDDGYFKPNEPVTRAHYAAFLQRLMNLDEDFAPEPIDPPKKETPKPAPKPVDPNPEPKPVEPKPKPETPKVDEKLKIKYSDATFEELMSIPVPKGYVPGEWEKKQHEKVAEIMAENKHGYKSAFNIRNDHIQENIKIKSNSVGVSPERFVEIVNWTIDTGKIYNGGTFTVFFDYNKGMVHTSGVRKGL